MNTLLKYVFTFLSVTLVVKGNTAIDHEAAGHAPLIVGGDNAPQKFGRFHASLQNSNGDHVCGGAVISRWHIVTAAHCLYDVRPEWIDIIVGTSDLIDGGIHHSVRSFVIYEGFNYTAKINDIALIMVDRPFDLNNVSVIAMDEEMLHTDDLVLISGFGALKVNGSSETSMQILSSKVFSQDTCVYAMRYTRKVTESMFCTFSKMGEGTCRGDSGSPILRQNKLAGLVSWGIPCAVGFPDVHTRIAPFVKWLRAKIHDEICDMQLNNTTYPLLKYTK